MLSANLNFLSPKLHSFSILSSSEFFGIMRTLHANQTTFLVLLHLAHYGMAGCNKYAWYDFKNCQGSNTRHLSRFVLTYTVLGRGVYLPYKKLETCSTASHFELNE